MIKEFYDADFKRFMKNKLTQREEFCLSQREKYPFEPNIFSHIPYYVELGERVHVSKEVLFAPHGFGYAKIEGKWLLIPHTGGIKIEDDVHIHERVTIARATIKHNYTVIGEGTKIDAHVHIAHNVQVGKHCLIISGSTIGGSTIIGDNCYIGIGAVIKNKLKIGNNVTIGMGAVVLKDIPDNTTVVGNPARPLVKK